MKLFLYQAIKGGVMVSTRLAACAVVLSLGLAIEAVAAPVPLQNATADSTQGGFPVANMLDGNIATGWATSANPSTAVFETVTNIPFSDTLFTFTLPSQVFGGHILGRFEISYTTSPRTAFADSLDNGGNLGAPAIWTPITPSTAFATFSNPVVITGTEVKATNTGASTDTITMTGAVFGAPNITGFRLRTIDYDGPGGLTGPGIPGNSNIVVSSFLVDAAEIPPIPLTPEPGSAALLAIAMAGGFAFMRYRKA